jgi:hypothetical protein
LAWVNAHPSLYFSCLVIASGLAYVPILRVRAAGKQQSANERWL